MKRDVYAYITTVTLVIAFGFSAFLIYSDNVLPFTTQATVKTTSVNVVPEVKGYIQELFVHEGEKVAPGTALFQIDPQPYQIEKQKSQAAVVKMKSRWTQAQNYLRRVKSLSKDSSVSKEALDDAQSDETIAYAEYLSAQASLKMAQLNLDRTLVKAKEISIVTNLSFTEGMYASPLISVIHLVKDGKQWIEADFTEKGLSALQRDQEVNIVYDALPNKVFRGKISSIDQAISSGLSDPDHLGEITSETRWIRPQQKIRVRVIPLQKLNSIVAGSRASVMLRGGSIISDSWMRLLSWLRFIY
ncbi:MAG: RND family efflux transporter MFP subunit [Psychromonas sp.]|jgi:RND family efflux transporter MFP subunit|uniref:HlyD family secretion protein n=1 Tax=Psychromonas sp. TaxID=1884585 RepID=UPI0039E574D2